MEAIFEYVTNHPTVLKILIIFILIVVAYFIFKQFLKLSFLLLLIALAGAVYHYYNYPQKMSEDVRKSVDAIKSGVDKGKSFYEDSKHLLKKAKEVPGEVNRLISGSKDKETKED